MKDWWFSQVRHFHLLRPEYRVPDGGERWLCDLTKWYCLFCIDTHSQGDGWQTEYQIKNHIANIHDTPVDECENGVHYCRGQQLLVILWRWRKQHQDTADHFGKALDSLGSVDDFLFEAGGK